MKIWCPLNRGKIKSIAASDAYEIVRSELVPAAGKEMDSGYYLKFAINSQGKLLVMPSFKPGGVT